MRRQLAVCCGSLGIAIALQAQPVTLVLRPSNGFLVEEFTRIGSVRELSDGRLIVADDWMQRLIVADFEKVAVNEVSRDGDGPGEYREVTGLFPLDADTTMLNDGRGRRWILFHRTRPVATIPMRLTSRIGPRMTVVGADRFGNVLLIGGLTPGRTAPPHSARFDAFAESLVIVRARRSAKVIDTVARLRGPYSGFRHVQKDIGFIMPVGYSLTNPLGAADQALLFLDGWIAIAYVAPYRVVWIRPDGQRLPGRPLPFDVVRVDERQQRLAIESKYPHGPEFDSDEMPDWPRELPSFLPGALLAGPDGTLFVRRTPDANRPGTWYDVIDRRAALKAVLRLPSNHRIAGFGKSAVYVVTVDERDVETVQRHPWP